MRNFSIRVLLSVLFMFLFTAGNSQFVFANSRLERVYPSPPLVSGTTSFNTGGNISGIAIDSALGGLLITDYRASTVTFYTGNGMGDPVLSTTMGYMTIPLNSMDTTYVHNPISAAFDTASHRFYVTNSNVPLPNSGMSNITPIIVISDSGTIVNTKLTTDFIDVNPVGILSGITFDTNNHLAFASVYGQNTALVIDTMATKPEVISGTLTGTGPTGITYDANTDTIYVANSTDKSVSVLEKTSDSGEKYTQTSKINLGFEPVGIAVDSESGSIYLSKPNNNTFGVLEPDDTDGSYVNTVPPFSTNAIAIDSVGGKVFIVSNDQNTLTVIDTTTNKVKNTYNIDYAQVLTYNPITNKLFVGTSDGKIYTVNAARL